MREPERALSERFGSVVRESGRVAARDRVIVAVSGGIDSCVLLHLLRFHPPLVGLELVVAHFDHRMRDTSEGDARWVGGLAEAWGVRAATGSASRALSSEADARIARYEFLEGVRREVAARVVLTAHHADDQAETVLFRLFRGTGIGGLRGIPSSRDPAVYRPFLGFWREELERYAGAARLSWREDPSNRKLELARNALRRRILPDAERLVAPAARRALVRLAGMAEHEEAGWESVLPELMRPLDIEEGDQTITLDRAELVRLHPAVRARVLRWHARRLGYGLDASTTGAASDFVGAATSGAKIELGGFLELTRELDRVVLAPRRSCPPDRPLHIPDPRAGAGEALLGGIRIPVTWGSSEVAERARIERFRSGDLRFPLVVRARTAGDSMRLNVGTKKLKKLFLEARIPPSRRAQTPLIVDAEGRILWVPGLARAAHCESSVGPDLGIGVG